MFVSLGLNCRPGFHIRDLQGRLPYLPFDFGVSTDFAKIVDLFDCGFADFFDYLVQDPYGYYANSKYSMHFPHGGTDIDRIRSTLLRRIERLRLVLLTEDVTFVRELGTQVDAQKLLSLLPGKKLILVHPGFESFRRLPRVLPDLVEWEAPDESFLDIEGTWQQTAPQWREMLNSFS